jgi:RNA polymerase sigma-70 factor (ECF subfamily)
MADPAHDVERTNELAIAFQDGDMQAFGDLVDHYQDRFYRIAYRVLGNPDASLDVVQDAFVKIHKNIASWDRRSRFFSWSYRVVTNLAIDSLRKRGRERKAWETRAANQAEFHADTATESLVEQEKSELVVRVKQAIEELPPGQRAIVALRHYEGFSLKEIAEVRGCALGTVKSTLHQAFRSLRRSLGREVLEQVASVAT